jgi:hypothetical protein
MMEVWATMKAIHQSKTITTKLQKILQNIKLEEVGDACTHFTGLLDLQEQLASMGKSWDDDEFTSILLDSLPPSYEMVINAISDLPAWPKSQMPVEASHVKLFPQTLPAQLLTAHSSGFRFHKLAVQPMAQFHDVCIQKPLAAFINHVAMCAGTTF